MSIFTRTPSAEDLRAELVTAHAAQRLERDEADRAMRSEHATLEAEIDTLETVLRHELAENRRLRATANALRGMA